MTPPCDGMIEGLEFAIETVKNFTEEGTNDTVSKIGDHIVKVLEFKMRIEKQLTENRVALERSFSEAGEIETEALNNER